MRNALYTENEDSNYNHNGMTFSTYDVDNDRSPANCALLYGGKVYYSVHAMLVGMCVQSFILFPP